MTTVLKSIPCVKDFFLLTIVAMILDKWTYGYWGQSLWQAARICAPRGLFGCRRLQIVTPPEGEYYEAQRQYAMKWFLFFAVPWLTVKVSLEALATRYVLPTGITYLPVLGFLYYRHMVLNFMPVRVVQLDQPLEIRPHQVRIVAGQFTARLGNDIVEIDTQKLHFDFVPTDDPTVCQITRYRAGCPEVCPIKGMIPEAGIPGQLVEKGPIHLNTIKIWYECPKEQRWKVSCIFDCWKSPRGHFLTGVLHGLAHMMQYRLEDLGVETNFLHPDSNGGVPFKLRDYILSSKHPIESWKITNFDGEVTANVLEDHWERMQNGTWELTARDMVVVTTDFNLSLMHVKQPQFKPAKSYNQCGKLYSVNNDHPSKTGFYPARVDNNPELARSKGLVNTSASSYPGTSGSAARTIDKEVLYVHAGGPEKAKTEFANSGFTPALVSQVLRKHEGGDPRPLYRQGIPPALEQSKAWQDIVEMCNAIDNSEETLAALKKQSDSLGYTLTAECGGPSELEKAAKNGAFEAFVREQMKAKQRQPKAVLPPIDAWPETDIVRKALVKAAYKKIRASKHRKHMDSKAIYAFIYARLNDAFPEFDPTIEEFEEEINEVEDGIGRTVFGGESWERYVANDFINPHCGGCVAVSLVEGKPVDSHLQAGFGDVKPCFWQHYKKKETTQCVYDDAEATFKEQPPGLKLPYNACQTCGNWDYLRDMSLVTWKGKDGVRVCKCGEPAQCDELVQFYDCESHMDVQSEPVVPEPLEPTSDSDSAPPLEPIPECAQLPELNLMLGSKRDKGRDGSARKRLVNKPLSPNGRVVRAACTTPKTFDELKDEVAAPGLGLMLQQAVVSGWIERVVTGKRTHYKATMPESGSSTASFEAAAKINQYGQLDYPEKPDFSTVQALAPEDMLHVLEAELRPLIELHEGSTHTVQEWCDAISAVGYKLSPTGKIDYAISNSKLFRDYLSAETQYKPQSDPAFDLFGDIGRPPMPPPGKRRGHTLVEPDDLAEAWGLVDEFGRVKGSLPPLGPEFELASLLSQLKRKKPRTRGYSMEHLREFAKGLPIPSCNWDQKVINYITSINQRMDAKKCAGWSRLTGALTNGDWVKEPNCLRGGLLSVALMMLIDHRTMATWTPKQMFEAGLIVPEEAQIKDEVHMNKKLDSERYRLIWMTSARSQFMIRFFHDLQNKVEIDFYKAGLTHSEEFPYFGACSGMGHDDDSIEVTCEAIQRLAAAESATPATGGVTSLDASGWDISVTRTLMMTDAWRRAHCAECAGAPDAFTYGIYNTGLSLSTHILRSGFSLYAIAIYGIVGSGMTSTTASNCFMRSFAHSEGFWAEVGRVAKSLANGDDCIGRDEITRAIVAIWESLGLRLDEEESIRIRDLAEDIEFTSHLYNVFAKSASYNNPTKLFLKIVIMHQRGKRPTLEQLAGLRLAVRNSTTCRTRLEWYIENHCPAAKAVTDWDKIASDMSLIY